MFFRKTTRPSHLHLHRSGHRGGRILPHRSIFSLQLPLHRLGVGLLIALGCTALLGLAQPLIEHAWGAQLVWWMQALQLPGEFQATMQGDTGLFSLAVPMIDVRMPDIGPAVLTLHALAAAAVWIAAGWLPDAAKPASYLLRFATIIHGTAIAYFLLWPGSFPHSGISHAAGGLRQGWALMLLTPWLHLCTYYLFPFAVWQRVAVTAATVLFLFVLTPLQYASHAALLSVLGLVALYGWAMSWYDPAAAAPQRP